MQSADPQETAQGRIGHDPRVQGAEEIGDPVVARDEDNMVEAPGQWRHHDVHELELALS